MPNIVIDGEGDVYLTPYKSYVALLTQAGTDAPTAIVLNSNDSNYLGNIVWTYDVLGNYRGTLTGKFTINKTVVNVMNIGYYTVGGGANDVNSIYVQSNLPDGTATDDAFLSNGIEIKVYP